MAAQNQIFGNNTPFLIDYEYTYHEVLIVICFHQVDFSHAQVLFNFNRYMELL